MAMLTPLERLALSGDENAVVEIVTLFRSYRRAVEKAVADLDPVAYVAPSRLGALRLRTLALNAKLSRETPNAQPDRK